MRRVRTADCKRRLVYAPLTACADGDTLDGVEGTTNVTEDRENLARSVSEWVLRGDSLSALELLGAVDPWEAVCALAGSERAVAASRRAMSEVRASTFRRLAEDHSVSQIANRLGITRQAVYQVLARDEARQRKADR